MDNVSSDEKLKLQIMKAQAVRQATVEVLGENRAEILKRARAKLTAMGVAVEESELGAQIS